MALPNHIHFLGIAGIGVSALAQIAQVQGCRVSGSDPGADPAANPAIARLLAGGAQIFSAHLAENLPENTDLVVASAAIPESNPELQEARRRGLPVQSRAEFLGTLMQRHKGVTIAVAGTHGKTTTTALLGVLLQEAGADPTVIVGAEAPQLGGNVRIGGPNGPLVVEACEAYGSFFHLPPDIALITNVEPDHLDYYKTPEGVAEAFHTFAEQAKTAVIYCADDAGAAAAAGGLAGRETIGCGIESGAAQSRASCITAGPTIEFTWEFRKENIPVHLNMMGRHNLLNALQAAAAAALLGIPAAAIAEGLAAFRGSERRQELLGYFPLGDDFLPVLDDYAHHPTEIEATLAAVKQAYPARRIAAVFQPHLYSRTKDFLEEFARTLSRAEVLIVTDIYAAREQPIPGVRASDIVLGALHNAPGITALYLPERTDIPVMLKGLLRPGDLVLFMGAGNIREQALALLQQNGGG